MDINSFQGEFQLYKIWKLDYLIPRYQIVFRGGVINLNHDEHYQVVYDSTTNDTKPTNNDEKMTVTWQGIQIEVSKGDVHFGRIG